MRAAAGGEASLKPDVRAAAGGEALRSKIGAMSQLSVLNPVGFPPKVTRKPPAPRNSRFTNPMPGA